MTASSSRPLRVFLCHSSGDKETVRELYRQLSAEDWIDPWLDEVKLLPGQEWDLEIEKAVEEADIVLACISTRSVDKEGYVQKELRFVLNIADEKPEGSLFVIPLRLDDCVVPRRLRHWQWVDYFPESQKPFAYKRLLESFKVRARELGILSEKPKEQPAPKPAEPVSAPKQLSGEEKPPEEQPELETLKSLAIQHELKGDFWNALQTYYRIREIDPAFPHLDLKIQELERELRPMPVERAEVNRQALPRSIPRKAIPWRLIAGIGGRILLVTLCIWGGVSLWNDLFSAAPEPTRTIQPVATKTDTLSPNKTSLPSTPSPTETLIPPSPTPGMIGKDGMTLLYVPAGEFIMGSDTGNVDEKLMHTVTLDAFWIDQTEVTNAMYAKCADVGVCNQPSSPKSNTRDSYYRNPEFDNYPVIYVDWNMAKTYCEWAGRRLPTESEWEKAARGENVFTYPWGNDAPNDNLLNYNRVVGDTTEVGAYPNGVSPYGVLDMAGNVWEWVEDWYDAYPGNATSNSSYGRTYRVLRGGSWYSSDYSIRSADRSRNGPTVSNFYIGFRCARSP